MARLMLSIWLLLYSGHGGFAQDKDEIDRPENERLAIAAIEEARGRVDYDYDKPGRPVKGIDLYEPTDDHLAPLTVFPNLQGIGIVGGTISDAGFARIAQFAQLDHISISRATISEAALAHLASLPKLKELWLDECTVAESGLVHLVKVPDLKRLSLRRSTVSDAGLVSVGQMVHLRDVDLTGTQVTDDGVSGLKEALPYALIVDRRGNERSEVYPFFSFVAIAASIGFVGLLVVLGSRRARAIRRRKWIGKCITVAVLIAIVGIGLLWLDPLMCPIQDGDAGTFWVHVCQIDVGAKDPSRAYGYYRPRDGWFIYYDQGFHGQFLHRVPASEAIALFEKLVEKLLKVPPGVLRPDVEQGLKNWLDRGAYPEDAAGFLARVHEARLDRARQSKDPGAFQRALSREEEFDERWERIGRYRWNLRFEFAFLTGLILFAAWAWLRGAGRTRCAIHLALVPTLYCLPYWLGYAQFTFTSAGPSGGVLYPWLLILLRGLPWSYLDTMILGNLPQPLEPLSQTPGPMMSISRMGGVGPVGTLLLGLVVFAVINWGPVLYRYVKARQANKRGGKVSVDGAAKNSRTKIEG